MSSTIRKGSGSVPDNITRMSALQGIAPPNAPQPNHGIALRERNPVTMLNLRGSSDQAFLDRARVTLGCELPTSSNSSSASSNGEILRLAPGEWLLVAEPEAGWSEDIKIEGATLTDVSHARVVVIVSGNRILDMLAKGCSVDLHPRQFPPGMCVQTSIAKIHVILHRLHLGNDYALYAARSYASSLWDWLTESAAEYGYHFARQ